MMSMEVCSLFLPYIHFLSFSYAHGESLVANILLYSLLVLTICNLTSKYREISIAFDSKHGLCVVRWQRHTCGDTDLQICADSTVSMICSTYFGTLAVKNSGPVDRWTFHAFTLQSVCSRIVRRISLNFPCVLTVCINVNCIIPNQLARFPLCIECVYKCKLYNA